MRHFLCDGVLARREKGAFVFSLSSSWAFFFFFFPPHPNHIPVTLPPFLTEQLVSLYRPSVLHTAEWFHSPFIRFPTTKSSGLEERNFPHPRRHFGSPSLDMKKIQPQVCRNCSSHSVLLSLYFRAFLEEEEKKKSRHSSECLLCPF